MMLFGNRVGYTMSYLRTGNVLNALAVFHGTGDDVGLVVRVQGRIYEYEIYF